MTMRRRRYTGGCACVDGRSCLTRIVWLAAIQHAAEVDRLRQTAQQHESLARQHRAKAAQAAADVAALEAELHGVTAQRDTAQDKVQQLTVDLEACRAAAADRESTITQLRADLSTCTEGASVSKSLLDKATGRLTQLESEAVAMANERSTLTSQLWEARAQLSQAHHEALVAGQARTAAVKDAVCARREARAAKEALEARDVDVRALGRQLAERESTSNGLRQQVAQLTAELSSQRCVGCNVAAGLHV